MAWYALDVLDAAVEETRELLLPFDWKLWAKVALLVLFTSGLNLPNSNSFSLPSDNTSQYDAGQFSDSYGPGVLETLDMSATGMVSSVPQIPPAFYAAFLVLLAVGVAFMIIASVFEFVYYQSLLDKNVVIRQNFKQHLEKGLRLFGFRAATLIGLLVVGLIAMQVFMMYQSPTALLSMVLAALPVILVLLIFFQLTNEFIPLVMMEHDVALIPAWKLFYRRIREEWKQVLLYVFMKLVLGIAVGIIVGITSILIAVVLLIPFGGLWFLLGASFSSPITWVLAAIGILFWFALTIFFLRVPAQTFLRYYTILVYQRLTS